MPGVKFGLKAIFYVSRSKFKVKGQGQGHMRSEFASITSANPQSFNVMQGQILVQGHIG